MARGAEAQPLRSILKRHSSEDIVGQTPEHRTERRKSQHWDEMNIVATYHPAGKDYGLMKVTESDTPYFRTQEEDRNKSAPGGSRAPLNPTLLAERLAVAQGTKPKVLQRYVTSNYLDNWREEDEERDNADFLRRRQVHYKATYPRQSPDDHDGRGSCSSDREGAYARPRESGTRGLPGRSSDGTV
ncbi:protein phosphatase inhibitor 2-like isoform X1 [Ascaphus truei]|uniref:protein phosphatase inhibitor 2-like isoform X1 n=1 Tax=Ascaphus truei TaxID=8439 RepID=UPI003F599A3F